MSLTFPVTWIDSVGKVWTAYAHREVDLGEAVVVTDEGWRLQPKHEGSEWLIGHYKLDTPEVSALLVTHALGRTE